MSHVAHIMDSHPARQAHYQPMLEQMEGSAKEVFEFVMVRHPFCSAASFLANAFVGLALEIPVAIHGPGCLDRTNNRLFHGLIEDACFGVYWESAAREVAQVYGINIQEV
ncbi:hypothetical protein NX722_13525 [Endozoicomonas gorgoniicola]|uniref:Sulfotransferase family protein n=1 Tax=Endozoicomonas gorgoniicola TaxID=1234144 RepID=A0ABT3MW77_9GAMM|nr:hypothetical protein [Endozoicomonas gorgoniicola]MCW7553628.1 hypothetical protein [Endozoicomonas gorgoniicola]